MQEDVATRLLDGVEVLATKVSDVISTYSEPVGELMLMYLRVDAASQLLIPLVFFTVLWWCLTRLKIISIFEGWIQKDPSGGVVVGIIIITMVTLGIAGTLLSHLFNLWAWIGIFYPEVYAVYKAMGLL